MSVLFTIVALYLESITLAWNQHGAARCHICYIHKVNSIIQTNKAAVWHFQIILQSQRPEHLRTAEEASKPGGKELNDSLFPEEEYRWYSCPVLILTSKSKPRAADPWVVPDRVIHVDTVADFTEDGVQKQTAGGQTPASAQGSESPLDLSLKSGARMGYCPGETPEEPPIPVLHFSHR